MGTERQEREGPGPCEGGGSVARPSVEGALRLRSAGDERASAEGAEASQGGKPVSPERSPALRGVRQALLGPGSQERPVRLLHLRDPVQRGSGDVQRPLSERPEAGDLRGGEDQGANPHRGDHHRVGAVGGRGDRRHGGGAVRETGSGGGGAIRRAEASWEALRSHRDERPDP